MLSAILNLIKPKKFQLLDSDYTTNWKEMRSLCCLQCGAPLSVDKEKLEALCTNKTECAFGKLGYPQRYLYHKDSNDFSYGPYSTLAGMPINKKGHIENAALWVQTERFWNLLRTALGLQDSTREIIRELEILNAREEYFKQYIDV